MKRARIISVLLIFAMIVAVFIPQQSVSALSSVEKAQQEKKDLEGKLSDIESQLKKEKSNLAKSENEIEQLEIKANIEKAEKERLAAQLLLLYNEIDSLEVLIIETEEEYAQKEADFYEKSRMMYVYSQKSTLQILAESESVADFFRRINLLLLVADNDKEMLDELVKLKSEIEYKKSMKDENAKEVDKLITQKDLNLKQIEMTKDELQDAINKTANNMKALQNEEQALKKETEEISRYLKELEAKKKKENKQSKFVGGVMVWPVPSSTRITSTYGRRTSPIFGSGEFHSGIDIGAPRGNSILAATDGEVVFSGWKGGYGNCIIIDHGGGITTLYGHASKLVVRNGEKVKKGQIIAKIGSTGWSTGPHLHFQVMKNGDHINPMPYLSK